MNFASLMSAHIAKSSGSTAKDDSAPRKYQKHSEVEAARLASYRTQQAALENERLAKQEKKRRLDVEEAERKEERETKMRKLAEKNRQLQEEERDQAERERRRRIGLPETPTAKEMEQQQGENGTPVVEEPDVDNTELLSKLRDLNEPARLFGETHEERIKRFYKIQRARSRKTAAKRADQPVQTSLEPLDPSELAIDKTIPPASDNEGRKMLARRISSWLNMVLFEWGNALGRRDEATKGSTEGQRAANARLQALQHLKPLFKKLEYLSSDPSGLPDDLLKPMVDIIVKAQKRQYVWANDAYLQLSIGKAAWPIGVTMVGIHERSSREKINESDNKAHIMSDEETRKILQSIKRCLTFAQTRWAPEDLEQLMG